MEIAVLIVLFIVVMYKLTKQVPVVSCKLHSWEYKKVTEDGESLMICTKCGKFPLSD